jgi:hypothetical protein
MVTWLNMVGSSDLLGRRSVHPITFIFAISDCILIFTRALSTFSLLVRSCGLDFCKSQDAYLHSSYMNVNVNLNLRVEFVLQNIINVVLVVYIIL